MNPGLIGNTIRRTPRNCRGPHIHFVYERAKLDIVHHALKEFLIFATNWRLAGKKKIVQPDGGSAECVGFNDVGAGFKVLGVEVKEEARGIFQGDRPKPTEEELTGVFALGENWNSSLVSDDKKRDFVANRWVLGETRTVPGEISAIMAITLVEGDQGIFDQFEQEVMPAIVGRTDVTTVYGGNARRRHIDYVLRITTDLPGLYH